MQIYSLNCPEIKYENLVVRDNLYFEKFKDYPFTGVSIGQKQGSIVNGKEMDYGKYILKVERRNQLVHFKITKNKVNGYLTIGTVQ